MIDPVSFSYGFAAGAAAIIIIFLVIAFWPVKQSDAWESKRPWP